MERRYVRHRTRKEFVEEMKESPVAVFVADDLTPNQPNACIVGECERNGGELLIQGPGTRANWSAVVRYYGDTITVHDPRSQVKPPLASYTLA